MDLDFRMSQPSLRAVDCPAIVAKAETKAMRDPRRFSGGSVHACEILHINKLWGILPIYSRS